MLRWPIELTPSGKFALATSDSEMWDLRMRSLLSTRQGERAMRTTYGCFLPERLFSAFSPTNPEDDVRLAVSQWLPMLSVTSVVVEETWEPAAYGQQDRVLRIRVDYVTPSQDTGSSYVALADKGTE